MNYCIMYNSITNQIFFEINKKQGKCKPHCNHNRDETTLLLTMQYYQTDVRIGKFEPTSMVNINEEGNLCK